MLLLRLRPTHFLANSQPNKSTHSNANPIPNLNAHPKPWSARSAFGAAFIINAVDRYSHNTGSARRIGHSWLWHSPGNQAEAMSSPALRVLM